MPAADFAKDLASSQIPLRFLLDEPSRAKMKRSVVGFSDSACFFHLWTQFGRIRESAVLAQLTAAEQALVSAFIDAFAQLTWRPLPTHPEVSELHPDDLSPLFRPAEPVLALLDRRTHVPWWGHLLRKIKKGRPVK